jgi:hypothetical protein
VSATVFVESGVYNEQITINKSITLQGAGSATTTLQAPTLAPDVNGQRNLITITGSGVNVEL